MNGGAMRMSRRAASLPWSSVSPPGRTTVTSSAHTAAARSASPPSSADMNAFAASSGVTGSFSRGGRLRTELDPFGPHPHAERGDRERGDDPGRGEVRVIARTEREARVALVADREVQHRPRSADEEIATAEDIAQGPRPHRAVDP